MIISNIDFNPLYKQRATNDSNEPKSSSLYKILPAKELLEDQAISFTIKDIEEQILIPKQNFQEVYLETIYRFAEFVQSLPNFQYQSFHFDKGHLLLALLRTSITLEKSDNYPCPIDSNQTSLSPTQLEKRAAIWNYIIFSSALLLDIGRSISGTIIETCKENGDNKTVWTPIDGAMTLNNNDNTHYYYKVFHQLQNNYNHKLNLILIRMLIPEYIFSWVYSEQDLFFEWLSLFEDEATGSGTLHKLNVIGIRQLHNIYMGTHLPQSVLKLIPNHIRDKHQKYHKDSFWKGVEFSLRGEKSQPRQAEQNYGVEFLNWLREGLANHSISVNRKDSKVHISKEGVFLINPEIFLEFSKKFPKYANWQAVFKQFSALGITKYSNDTNIFQYHFPNLETPRAKRGLIIEDPKILYGQQMAPGISPEISTKPYQPIANSTIFPTPREEAGAYLRRAFNPYPKPEPY